MQYRNPIAAAALLTGCLVVFAVALPAIAETENHPKNEFKIGVGMVPIQTIAELFTDVTVTAATAGTVEPSTGTKLPLLFAEYVRSTGKRTHLIAHFNITRYEKSYSFSTTNQHAGKITNNYATLMLGAKYDYVRSDWITAYIDIMAGASMVRAEADTDDLVADDMFLLAYQVTPLGLRIGKTTAVDVSVGLGFKGTLSIGVNYAF